MSLFQLPDGRQMAYTLSTNQLSRPVILLSNSLCEDYTSWDRITPVIEGLGFDVLRYDQPGHGRSSAPSLEQRSNLTFEIMADDVAHLLTHLNITRLHAWIGVSMGGIMGIYFAVRHKGIINKLLVADAVTASPEVVGVPDVFEARVVAAKTAGTLEGDLASTRKRWFGETWMAINTKETARMKASMATTTMEGLESCCSALSNPSFDLRPLYSRVGGGCDEALIVVGEKDADLPVKMEEMRCAIEKSLIFHKKKVPVDMDIIKNAGHVPYIDGFEDFCNILKHYL